VEKVLLDELARYHGTDKSSLDHNFTPIYEDLFNQWRDQPVKVLEIGVYKGAGLRMWRDYFSVGRVVGIEADPSAVDQVDDRIKIYVGDQADSVFLDEVASEEGPFDIVIDDGGHRAMQQKVSLLGLWPHVKGGGAYVLEDIHTSYYESYEMGWRKPETTVELLKYVIDDVHVNIHKQPVTLAELESIQFFPELCIMRRKIV
jgi:demethylmacrocin O-methyltransferase